MGTTIAHGPTVNVDENGNVLAIIDWKFFADQVATQPVSV
jgi:hypothetical protein